jgi:putative ABC transport system permease protein
MVGVSSDYFATLAVPVVQGREFDERDGQPGLEHAIVNRRFAALYFSAQDPMGRRLRLTSPDTTAPSWLTIVGLADDIRQRATPAEPEPIVYVPWRADAPATTFVLVRSGLDPATTTDLLRRAAMTVDAGLPLYRTTTLRQFVRDAQWNGRVSHQMIVMLTMLALGLALVGLYAVMSHTVTERTREIGLRMAIGASPEDVRRLILSRAAWQISLGLVAGVAGSVIWDAVFFSGRPDVRLTAWHVLLPVAGVLIATTAAACWLPLRRATRLDPSAALRQE